MLNQEQIDALWAAYGMSEEECQLADEPIEVVIRGEDMVSLLDMAEMLLAVKWCEENFEFDCENCKLDCQYPTDYHQPCICVKPGMFAEKVLPAYRNRGVE